MGTHIPIVAKADRTPSAVHVVPDISSRSHQYRYITITARRPRLSSKLSFIFDPSYVIGVCIPISNHVRKIPSLIEKCGNSLVDGCLQEYELAWNGLGVYGAKEEEGRDTADKAPRRSETNKRCLH